MASYTPAQAAFRKFIQVLQQQLDGLRTRENSAEASVANALVFAELQRLERALRDYGWEKDVIEKPEEKPAKKETPRPVGAGAGDPSSDELPDRAVIVPTTLARTVTGLGYEPSDARVGQRKGTACPCRAAAGHMDGWCGVAGGGVPACDH